jgi:hypothetical protein
MTLLTGAGRACLIGDGDDAFELSTWTEREISTGMRQERSSKGDGGLRMPVRLMAPSVGSPAPDVCEWSPRTLRLILRLYKRV